MKFSDLEVQNDGALVDDQSSSLMDWYRSIRDVPIDEMEVDDLCRAIRQRLFVAHVLPVAVSHLEGDVLAGDDYEGRLVASLRALTGEDWIGSPIEARRADRVLRLALMAGQLPLEIRREVHTILANMARP